MAPPALPWYSDNHNTRQRFLKRVGLWDEFKTIHKSARKQFMTNKDAWDYINRWIRRRIDDLVAEKRFTWDELKQMGEPESKESLEKAAKKVDEVYEAIHVDDRFSEDALKKERPDFEDFKWALENLHDMKVKRCEAPSKLAWSIREESRMQSDGGKSLISIVSRMLPKDDNDDVEDGRAFSATGLPQAIRERFSGLAGEVREHLARELSDIL